MATLNELIELVADELGVDTDAVKVDVKAKEIVIKVFSNEAEDLFDEDYGLGDDDDEDDTTAISMRIV
jgi:hypothetical protein